MPSPFLVSPEQIMQEKDDLARKGIERGREVVALEYEQGFAFVAQNSSLTLNKISEIYDRIAFAGVGSFQEYDPLRMVGIEQAEIKGYTYSREDVTAKWLANLYSQYIGNVWRQFDAKPLEIELLVAEVGEEGYSSNRLYRISYDGRLTDARNISVIGGKSAEIKTWMEERYRPDLPLEAAVRLAVDALKASRQKREGQPPNGVDEPISDQNLEIAVLDKRRGRRKFRRASKEEIAALGGET